MKRIIISIILCVFVTIVVANDGSYYISGNSLKPLVETRIGITKEILTITKNRNDASKVDVSVYYEMNNPDAAKKLVVGFEAMPPGGDVDPDFQKGHHPYMTDFMVEMNGEILPYDIHMTSDSSYYENGAFKNSVSSNDDYEYYYYMYVYHFEANFKPGKNIIKHTYTCDLSASVIDIYSFDYVLKAAMRWGNRQIDDFTLILDMGDEQLLRIPHTFFDSRDEWVIAGLGKAIEDDRFKEWSDGVTKFSLFYIKNGKLIFQKKNFKAKDDLYFSYSREMYFETFDKDSNQIIDPRFMIEDGYFDENLKTIDFSSRRVLRNLPFAMRGYIFKNKELQDYFEKQIWYYPNQEYTDTKMSDLSEREQLWVKNWSE